MNTKIINYNFDQDFKELSDSSKELIALGVWSLYKLTDTFLIVTDGGCKCCHGTREKSFFLINKNGSFIERKDQSFYQNCLNQDLFSEIVKLTVPERLKKNYIKINI